MPEKITHTVVKRHHRRLGKKKKKDDNQAIIVLAIAVVLFFLWHRYQQLTRPVFPRADYYQRHYR